MLLLYLEWAIAGSNTSKTVQMNAQKSIGRNADNTFVIADKQVSSVQATLRDVAGSIVITNVSRSNNIKVGDQIVSKNGGSTELSDKITILMGTTSLYARVTVVEDSTVKYVACTTCSRPIPEGTEICPWCDNSQSGISAAYTMA